MAAVGTVDVKRHGGAWIVGLRGEHDLSTQPMLTRHLRALGRTGDGLVVDLAHVEFIDSTVIGAPLGAYKGAGGETAMPSVMEVPSQEVDGGKDRSRSRA